MRRAINFLLVLAVLWCGLHLSPAEADEGAGRSAGISVQPYSDGERADDHSQPHVAHGCHSHCPLASGANLDPALNTMTLEKALHYAAPVDPLKPIVQAPPVEPPSA